MAASSSVSAFHRIRSSGSATPAYSLNACTSRSRLNLAVQSMLSSAALAAGGRDNGAPGLRLRYAENYYSAYVLDPDGHNIEAVCRL